MILKKNMLLKPKKKTKRMKKQKTAAEFHRAK